MVQQSVARTAAETIEDTGPTTDDPRPARLIPARTPYEEAIAAIWRDLLERADFGVADDFFELGGHSLLALKVLARIRKTFDAHIPVMDFFEAPTVAALASAVATGSCAEPRVVRPRPADAEPVLSFDQQRLWLEYQLLPAAAYNVHGRRRLLGPIDVEVLEASIRAILERHEALRTRFVMTGDHPVQVVDPVDERRRLRIENVGEIEGDRDAIALRLADEDATAPFDLGSGPLLRCLLIRLSETEHIFSVTMHHIVSDAWSIAVFVRELSALYEAGGDVERAGLPELPVQYLDFAVWQRERLAGEELAQQVEYWRQHLDGAPPTLTLPTATQSSTSEGMALRITSTLSADETAALHELCRKQGVTSFMALLASLATVLGRWAGQSDLVVGVPIAGRNETGTDALIGFFVNTLPLRVDLAGEPTFAELLTRVRQTALGGYANADAPLDVIVKELDVARDPRRTPLFQVLLNVIDSPEVEQSRGVVVQPLDRPNLPSKFDLILTAQEIHGALRLQLDFNVERYQATMMHRLSEHLGTLLRAVVQDPDRAVLDYPFDTATPPAAQPPIEAADPVHLAVRRQAGVEGRIAIVDADGPRTFRWLDRAADRVARRLSEQGIGPADRLGVVRRPTAAGIAAIVGAGQAAGAVSIVEPDSPVPAQFLGVTTLIDVAPSGPGEATDLSDLFADDLEVMPAGPTGDDRSAPPIDWAVQRFGLGRDDRIAVLSGKPGQLMSGLATAVRAGATFVLPGADDLEDLAGWLDRTAITVVYLTAPVLRALAGGTPAVRLPALRHVFVDHTGDLIAPDLEALRRLASGSTCTAMYRAGPDGRPLAVHTVPDDWQPRIAPLRVPLGRELPHRPAQLRHPGSGHTGNGHADGRIAAIGEVAELCFGGYRTGDLARRWPDGTLEYVGAAGTTPTVDPVEVVAAVRALPQVHDAVVTEQPAADGRTVLIGYLTGPDTETPAGAIRQHLLTRLPAYLIPSRLFILDRLPLTAEGAYDFDELPDPDGEADAANQYVAPRTPLEHQLTAVLQELLGVERVGIYDSFFELGGFSLLATQLTTRVREMYDVELPLREVFTSPTVDGLAQLIVLTQGEQSGAAELEALLSEIEHAQDV